MSGARVPGLILLVLLMLGGLVTALFSPVVAMTLTLPSTAAVGLTTPTAPAPAEPDFPSVGPTGTAQPTQLPSGVTVLAQDTFQRPNQALWGQASDGQVWAGDANSSPLFSIANDAGQVSGGIGVAQATLGTTGQNAELLACGTVNQFNTQGTVNFGAVLRWQDAQNWYKALIDGNHLQLLKSVQGKTSVLATQVFHATDGTAYCLRMRVLGSNLFAKAWPDAQTEPGNWMLLAIDTDLRTGAAGIRLLLAYHTVIRVSTFVETTVPNAFA